MHKQLTVLAILASLAACGEPEPLLPSVGDAVADTGSQTPTSDLPSGSIPSVLLVPAFPKLSFNRPVFITSGPVGSVVGEGGEGDASRMFVVEQLGQILMFENRSDVESAEVFLDIRSKVRMKHNEEGLLSLVFHPNFKENRQFFIYYTVDNPKRNRISRFTLNAGDPTRADPASEEIIMEVEQPWANHNGSTLLFGSDGYFYASFGDGGAANDPDLNGQNLSTLLASVIRIDVDREENGQPYAIPKDNPFVDRQGARAEIWAYGLRNVWRMSFDRQTGDLWAGDVGQDQWEEIDLIAKGGNYGWNLREGTHPFPDGIRRLDGKEPSDPVLEPVIDYSHRQGISVTGGYVYRGSQQPRLQGVYVYADYGSRRIWGLRYEDGKVTAHREMLSGRNSAYITSFGEDANGELFACTFDRPDRGPGKIYRVIEN